jgi:hypothetical protein
MAQLGCGVAQYRVRCGSVEGCGVAQFRVRRGSVDRVQHGSVRVQCDSVQGAAWIQFRCEVTQYGVQLDSVEGCGIAQLIGCSVT